MAYLKLAAQVGEGCVVITDLTEDVIDNKFIIGSFINLNTSHLYHTFSFLRAMSKSWMKTMNMQGPLTGPDGMTRYVYLVPSGPANSSFCWLFFSTWTWLYPDGTFISQRVIDPPKELLTASLHWGIGNSATRVIKLRGTQYTQNLPTNLSVWVIFSWRGLGASNSFNWNTRTSLMFVQNCGLVRLIPKLLCFPPFGLRMGSGPLNFYCCY